MYESFIECNGNKLQCMCMFFIDYGYQATKRYISYNNALESYTKQLVAKKTVEIYSHICVKQDISL